ncbi:MAG: molybdopterin-dependent oxidoreductase [Acidobacteria bacterium]|nr:molybdopterin-dependent oxidoreductase [Acidobacteriota bacterium]
MHTRFSRRAVLAMAVSPLAAAAQKRKLLLPSDTPNEHHFRLMWANPIPPIDAAAWRLRIDGLVDKPVTFDLAALRKLPAETQNSRMKCVQCWSARAAWGGFRFGHLLELAKPTSKAKAVRIDCGDKWYESFYIKDLLNPRVLFVLDMAGKPLSEDHGAPLRLMDPARYGYKSAKVITSLTFTEEIKGSMACDSGPFYSLEGVIKAGYDTPLDLDGGKSRRKIAGGEIAEY